MNTADDTVKHLLASPFDRLARLALADRLEEMGRDDEAELTRLTVLLDGDASDPAHAGRQKRVQELIARGVVPVVPTTRDSVGIEFVPVWLGEFMMGSPSDEAGRLSDETQKKVTIRRPFWISRRPITQGQYRRVMGHNPSYFRGDDRRPVETVSWYDAVAFCRKLSEMEGREYDLPTEEEWEYACRAGTTTLFHSGDSEADLDRVGWYADNSKGMTHPVGKKQPNAWGLYDVHGNVWEWCALPRNEREVALDNFFGTSTGGAGAPSPVLAGHQAAPGTGQSPGTAASASASPSGDGEDGPPFPQSEAGTGTLTAATAGRRAASGTNQPTATFATASGSSVEGDEHRVPFATYEGGAGSASAARPAASGSNQPSASEVPASESSVEGDEDGPLFGGSAVADDDFTASCRGGSFYTDRPDDDYWDQSEPPAAYRSANVGFRIIVRM